MRSFHYKGKFDGIEENLPQREHPEGYVPFKEAENMKQLSILMNIFAAVIAVALLVVVWLVSKRSPFDTWGIIAFIVSMVPHEFLHGICFKGDVYMYQNIRQGMLFVVSPDDLSKSRFVLMSMCPNIVFGVIPFILFLVQPNWIFFGTMGALAISAGAGDYYNVFNALTQMPKGALTYLSGMHSYWYMPKTDKED